MNLTVLALLRLSLQHGFIEIPENLKIGVASSAYQIEGGWNEDGKGLSIWDAFSHTLKENGDIACDSYHQYEEDVKMVKYLGVDHYRFSISWPRILPNGDMSVINQKGVEYYHKLIDALLINGIEPVVTLYHWDLPLVLHDKGGWLTDDIKHYFANYSRFIFQEYGHKVKTWFTINEPKIICIYGYSTGKMAPGIKEPAVAPYVCAHNILKAHAEAYHIYNDEFRPIQKGRIAFLLDIHWIEPATEDPKDVEARDRIFAFNYELYADPVFSSQGNYPKLVRDRVAERSRAEKLPKSRLPEFTAAEIERIRGTSDFFGVNTYMTYLAEPQEYPIDDSPSIDKDIGVRIFNDPKWEVQAEGWSVVPVSMRKLLNWIHTKYNKPEIFIAENGYYDITGTLEDDSRVSYYRRYLKNALLAVYEDGVNLTGYTAWSLMDNLEWAEGYRLKFGLYHVDFNDPKRKRTIKKSGEFYKEMIASRKLTISSSTKNTPLGIFIISFLVLFPILY